MKPWQKVISQALLEKELNVAVTTFAEGICESLQYLRDNLAKALKDLDTTERSGSSANTIASALDYIDELMQVLRCK